MAEIYNDSKTFVDKKLRYSPELVLANFSRLMNQTENAPSRPQLVTFVDMNFDAEGSEFQPWDPSDWVPNPSFLDGINSIELREWALQVHDIWKMLGRSIKGERLIWKKS